MDQLWDELVRVLPVTPAVRVLPQDGLRQALDRMAERYVADTRATWWWNALRVPGRVVPYGDDEFQTMGDQIPADAAGSIILVVTDDEPDPAGAVVGPWQDLVRMLGELPPFEFFLTDERGSWAIFDTHHNELIVVP